MTEELFEMLKEDHDHLKKLLVEAIANEESFRFREIKNKLNIHMDSEEKYFYPRVKPIDEYGINQSIGEHEEARKIIKDMENIYWKDEEWMDKLNKLKDTVEDHIEREEDLIFPESERLTILQREEIAQKIEEEKISKKLGSISNSKSVSIPRDIDVPSSIPASKVKIPSIYAEGEVEYEDDDGNNVSKENATHIRLTGIDDRTDLVIGPVEGKGMIKLTMYQNNENMPTTKEKATKRRSKIFNEEYRPLN